MEFELTKDKPQQRNTSNNIENPELLYQMANLFYEDVSDPDNEYKAFELYAKASNLGYAPAQNSLGILYETGYGIDYDPITAAYWYTKAISQGSDVAMVNLARLKMQGDIENDYEGARRLLEKALRMGNRDASELLGYLEEHKPWNAKQKFATLLVVLGIIPWTMFAVSFILPILASMGLEHIKIGFLLIIAIFPAFFLLKFLHSLLAD